MVVHTFNPSIYKAEALESLISRTARVIQGNPVSKTTIKAKNIFRDCSADQCNYSSVEVAGCFSSAFLDKCAYTACPSLADLLPLRKFDWYVLHKGFFCDTFLRL